MYNYATFSPDDPETDAIFAQANSDSAIDPGPISTTDPAYIAMMSGNSPSTASPAQGSSTGSQILGWLGLANNVAQTALSSQRLGTSTSRPGVNKPASSLGSFGSVTTTTLIVIVLVFVGVLFLLREK